MFLELQIVLGAVVIAGLVAGWFGVKCRRALDRLKKATSVHAESLEELLLLGDRMAAVEMELAQLKAQRKEQAEWASRAESVNLNRRGQVLRLHDRRDSLPTISETLRIGQGEVRLMIKVQEILRAQRADKK